MMHAAGTSYQQMSGPLNFVQDFAGVSNWVMRPPRVIFTTDLRNRHTFTNERVSIEAVNQPNLEERWKYFVITKGDGKRYYCTSQIYYERGALKFPENNFNSSPREVYRYFWLPKCIVLMSELPYYKIQVNLLKIHKELRRQEPIITHSVNESLYRIFVLLVEQGRQNQWENIPLRQNQLSKKITPSIQFTFNYYLTMCNEHRYGQALFLEKKTNREVLHVYRLQENSFYELSYFFHLPFSAYSLRIILSAIFQEKQIIFASNNANLTALVIQTLMKMIIPFKWCYMYVPNLPSHLIEPAQQSFMPYIVGISKKYLSQIDTSQRIVVDIEQDRVTSNGDLQLFHSNFTEYLLYKNSDNKNYLQWQKQIRIKSLILVHSLLKDCFEHEMAKTQRSLRASYVSLGGESNIRSIQRLPSQSYLHEQKNMRFIEELVNNSMMYKNFKEDASRGLCQQTYRLVNLNRDQKRIYLNGIFNITATQAQYPTRFDNQKKYIKHYDKANGNRRKFKFDRYSLNINELSMVYQPVRPPGTHSLVASQFMDSRVVAQSIIFG